MLRVTNILSFFCVFFILLLPLNAKAEKKLYKIGVYSQTPPISYTTKDGKLAGFDIDIAKAICKQMNAKCEFIKIKDFNIELFAEKLNNNEIDFIVSGITKTKEREKLIDFTDKYYSSSVSFAVKSHIKARNYKDLENKTIGVVKNTTGEDIVKKLLKDKAFFISFDTSQEMVDALLNNYIDAATQDTVFLWSIAVRNKKINLLGKPIQSKESICIAVKKGNDDLREKINQALKSILENNIYHKINRKYFPFPIY